MHTIAEVLRLNTKEWFPKQDLS